MLITLDLEYENHKLSKKLVLLCTQGTLVLLTGGWRGPNGHSHLSTELLLSSKHRLQNHHSLTFKKLLEPPGREEEGGHCAPTWMKLQKPLDCVCDGPPGLCCARLLSVLMEKSVDISSSQLVDILERLTGSSRENLVDNFYIGPHQH